MRLSTPTGTRLSTAKQPDLNYGGAKANAAISLAIFGHETTFVTHLPDHTLILGMIRYLRGLGGNTNTIIKGGKKVESYFLDVGVVSVPQKSSMTGQALPLVPRLMI
jgi:2-dehydro-3-deoxygluconokinase